MPRATSSPGDAVTAGGVQASPEPPSSDGGGGRVAQEDSRLVQEAVRAARHGDCEAMHFLYIRFAPEVQRHVAGLGHVQQDAEDVTRAVFGNLLTSIGRYQQREGPFAAWILRVAESRAAQRR